MSGEAGGLVYTAEETPPLGTGCGTGDTKPLKLKYIFAREAERGGSPHCQRKQDHNWCSGSKWLWHSLGAWEGQLGRWELETAQAMRVAVPSTTPEMGVSDRLLLLSVFTCQAFTHHTVSLAPRPAALFWGPGSLKAPPHTYQATAGSSWVVQRYSSRPSPSRESLGQACSLPCNQTHLMAHPWPGHYAVSPIREEETRIG